MTIQSKALYLIKRNEQYFKQLPPKSYVIVAQTFMISAKYLPCISLVVFIKMSRIMEAPIGLYLALHLSNLWNVFLPWK